MDQIGIICKAPADGFRILSIIAGKDSKDGAMYLDDNTDESTCEITDFKDKQSNLRIGIPVNVISRLSAHDSRGELPQLFAKSIGELLNQYTTIDFELKYFDVYRQIMQILCSAEISCNISRYDGIKYGYRTKSFSNLNELYTKSRTEALGIDAKLAAIIGAMVLSEENYTRYYDKAMRIRQLIKKSLEFDKYDAIIIPATTGLTTDIGAESSGTAANTESAGASGVQETVWNLELHALPRLCGLPAVTMPTGMTIIANARREDILRSVFDMTKAVQS
jgi:aspartyl-tRNA(Asn)/glutamyl-tRNA(Gln) amidotransferase subunit A